MLNQDGVDRLRGHLCALYGEERAEATMPELVRMLEAFVAERRPSPPRRESFDQTDVWLVSYGDQVREPGRPPLESLRRFLAAHVGPQVSGLHLLPHYPSTSDDGYAVADFTSVDPALGGWRHVEGLAADFRLMLDAVVNHTSASHPWFTGWLRDDPDCADFYLDVDPSTDLRAVVRPRTTPLLTPTATGRSAWSTFSEDQIDLNYANPAVLLAVSEVLLEYVAHGAGMLRFDAVAFVWKRLGTSCLHLWETHEVVRFWRTVLDLVAPGTLVVTETNVPHEENLTYFGSGSDEAHLVYQFALPPLTLSAFHRKDARRLEEWARSLESPSGSTSFVNFLASHDGIGLRAAEGLLPPSEIEEMCARVAETGGQVSYREDPAGEPVPYELNAVYLDALRDPRVAEDQRTLVDRFVAAHAIMLALPGIPLLYFQSLFGSRNWVEGVTQTGRPRVINRQRFTRVELESELADPDGLRRRVLDRLLHMVEVRTSHPAFHPNADQRWMEGDGRVLASQRSSLDGGSTLVCITDVTGKAGRFRARPPDRLPSAAAMVDLLDGSEHVVETDGTIDVPVEPYGTRWLAAGAR